MDSHTNRTPDDILLRPQLDRFAAEEEEKQEGEEEPQFQVWYTVDRLPPRKAGEEEEEEEESYWPFGLGHVTAEMIEAHLPPPGPGTLVAICGPPPFVHYACRPALERLGYPPAAVFEF
jgi:NAD(P)H-flavin reductase